MRTIPRTFVLGCLSLLLVAAASAGDAEELVRRANAAFDRQEYEAAVKLFTEAEATIRDPGLVAYNKAAALYRLNRFSEAQAHYQRCLDEADPGQRAVVLYDLGNCLLQQAVASGNLSLFREAVATFERSVAEPAGTDTVKQNARHNLELTKLLWLQARLARANQKDPEGEEPRADPPPTPQKGPDGMEKTEDGANPQTGVNPKPAIDKDHKTKMDGKENKNEPIPTTETSPGKGHEPPLPPEKTKLESVSVEKAMANLQKASEKIRDERAAYRLRAAPKAMPGVPDW